MSKKRRNRLPDGRRGAHESGTVATSKPYNWTGLIIVGVIVLGFVVVASR